ncbi:MAG: hypothetical protein ABWK05_03905 [Pyrobaculum sp.]
MGNGFLGRGHREPERFFLNEECEFDVYYAAVVGEAKVRAGPNVVERLAARVEEAARWPDRFQDRIVKMLYCLVARPAAVEKAKELGVWLAELGQRGDLLPGGRLAKTPLRESVC